MGEPSPPPNQHFFNLSFLNSAILVGKKIVQIQGKLQTTKTLPKTCDKKFEE